MIDGVARERWGGRRGLLAFALLVGIGGCGPGEEFPRRPGPDARVIAASEPLRPEADGWWPSTSLRLTVARPSLDQNPRGGNRSIDPRLTLAVVDLDRATWIMEARLDDGQGLRLIEHLENALGSMVGKPVQSTPLRARVSAAGRPGPGPAVIPGGHWGPVTHDEVSGTLTLELEDDQSTPVGCVQMDPWMAQDLILRLRGAIRGSSG